MAWSVIREATNEDRERMAAARARFMERHGLDEIGFDMLEDGGYGESQVECEKRKYLRKLWRACMRRALREPSADGIAYGHVGYYAD